MENFWNFFGVLATYTYAPTVLPWHAVPANYMFAKWMGTWWQIFYVGQTKDASDRFPHDRWAEAVREYGATHVLTHVSSDDLATREREEQDLIRVLNPPMNVQHKPKVGALGLAEALLSSAPRPGLGALSGLDATVRRRGLINSR